MVSAVIIAMEEGGELGWAAHWRVWFSLVRLRPAKARVLKGEEGEFRNFKASLTTYLPVNPEAPRITMSNSEFWVSSIFGAFVWVESENS